MLTFNLCSPLVVMFMTCHVRNVVSDVRQVHTSNLKRNAGPRWNVEQKLSLSLDAHDGTI